MGLIKFRRTTQINGPLTVGYSGSGFDAVFYGDTSGAYLTWDSSEDEMVWTGNARFTKDIWIGARDMIGSASANLGQYNSLYPAMLITAPESGSTDSSVYFSHPSPKGLDTAACLAAYAYWYADTAAASQAAQLHILWKHYGDGEATAGTTGSHAAAGFRASSSAANAIEVTTLSTSIDPPAAGDIMGFQVVCQSAGSSTAGSDFGLLGVKVTYTANKLGETL